MAKLVEVPTDQMDRLALMNELVAKRQEEADDLRIQLSNLRHSLQQERIQWEEQRRQEEQGLQLKRVQLDQAHLHRMADADAIARARQDAFEQTDRERQAAVGDRHRLMEDRARLGDLNRERVEIERLRAQVVSQQQASARQFEDGQAALNTANQRLAEATRVLREVETRTAHLTQQQTRLASLEEELNLRAKHLNTVQEAIGQIVEQLPVSTPPTPPPPVSLSEPPPSPERDIASPSPSDALLPPGDPAMREAELAPQVMPEDSLSPPVSESVSPQVQAWQDAHRVHPSQRTRVYDPSKPINDQ